MNIKNELNMKIILTSIFIICIIQQSVLLIWDIWDCLHGTRGEKMIIDGYQRENMFKDLMKDLNRELNSIQIPTSVDTNESSTKQIVYKIDGDFNGDIKGDNVTVILMGDGNINGDIESKDGNVVLIKGDINGDVKTNKIICPDKPSNEKWVAPSTCCINLKCPSCNQIYTQELNTSVKKINNNKYKVDIEAPYSKTKKEESEISNYLSVHPVYIECPKCHHFFDEKLRVDTSVINNKVLHTMITPASHENSYY